MEPVIESRTIELVENAVSRESSYSTCKTKRVYLYEATMARRKALCLAYLKLGTTGRWVGIRTGAGVTATLV